MPADVTCHLVADVAPRFADHVPLDRLRLAASLTLAHEGVAGDCEVSLTVCDDATIHALNREYLRHDRPTDVLSFPLAGPGAGPAPDELPFPSVPGDVRRLGDVVISYETAAEQAREFGHSTEREFLLLFVHGLLHLLGHTDYTPDDREAMHRRAEEIIAGLRDQT